MSDIQTLMRSANPIPEASTEFGQDDLDALLRLTQERSGNVDAKELTKPIAPKTRQRPWLVAIAAAAVVMLVVGGIAVLSLGDDDAATVPTTTLDGAPTTTVASPTTTVVAEDTTTSTVGEPVLNLAEQAYVQALVDELNAGDHEAAAARVYSSGVFESAGADADSQIDERPRTAGRWGVWVALDSVIQLSGCTTLTSGGTRCEIARSSPNDFSSPDPELSTIQVRLDDSGALAYMRTVPIAGAWNTPQVAFEFWIDEKYPEHYQTLFFNFSDPAATADLYREYYAQFLEDAGGP